MPQHRWKATFFPLLVPQSSGEEHVTKSFDSVSNSELVVGQGEFECSIVTTKDVHAGEEFLIDYHHLLVKLRIARSCGCYECVGALQSPERIPGSGIHLCVPL